MDGTRNSDASDTYPSLDPTKPLVLTVLAAELAAGEAYSHTFESEEGAS
jgi:hypothetical protein